LGETALKHFPLGGRDDAWQQVKRENFFRARGVAIHVKRHTLPEEGQVNGLAFEIEFLGRERLEQLPELAVVRAHLAGGVHHLIKKILRIVAFEQTIRWCGFSLGGHWRTATRKRPNCRVLLRRRTLRRGRPVFPDGRWTKVSMTP
jgi:hypothetical protein